MNNDDQPRQHTPRSFRYAGLRFRPVPQAGAYYAAERGELYTVPMNEDGSPDRPAMHRVTTIEDRATLRRINLKLGTSFHPWDFNGRR